KEKIKSSRKYATPIFNCNFLYFSCADIDKSYLNYLLILIICNVLLSNLYLMHVSIFILTILYLVYGKYDSQSKNYSMESSLSAMI
ncbi:hypothetical protein, partial [Fischerella thermalis]